MGRPEVSPVPGPEPRPAIFSQTRLSITVFLIVVFGSLISVWWISPSAGLTSILDAVSASIVLAPAVLFGHALIRFFKFPALQRRWLFTYSAALGLGSLSILVLLFGLGGVLNRSVWLAVLALMAFVGVLALRRLLLPTDPCSEREGFAGNGAHPAWRFLWFVAAPFLTLALLAASNPPGMIWQEEGNGYDVLEYHLQLPKEYYQNHRIGYVPHNVYANFPANMEMLYLLAMVVHDDVQDIGTTANMIHLAFALLTAFAAWAIGRDISPQAGIVGGLAVATCTWLEYLSGLAYVENGMLFLGMCAMSATLRGFDQDNRSLRWPILAGLLAGFAAGCKYTAIPMLVAPIAIAWLFPRATWQRRFANMGTFCLFAAIAASPWLIKNWHYTGNPVFPIANKRLAISAPHWSDEQTAQWNRAHSADVDVGISERLAAFWEKIPGDPEQRFGPAILLVGLLGLAARPRNRIDAAIVGILWVQIGVWLLATHLYARFAAVLIVPLGILVCRAVPLGTRPRRCLLVIFALIASAGWNLTFAVRRHARESAPGAPASFFYNGNVPGFEYLGVVNRELPPDSHLLLLGDARPFYVFRPADYFVAFNRNPFFEELQSGDGPKIALEWLRKNNYTHLLVDWSEVRRIARTYRFSSTISEGDLSGGLHAMTDSGLRLVRSFSHPAMPRMRYVELYEVVPTPD